MTIRQELMLSVLIVWLLAISTTSAQGRRLAACDELSDTFFFAMSLEQLDSEFLKRDLDAQFFIYICGMQNIHPPMTRLATVFASQGPKAAEYLRGKLAPPVDDLTVRDILVVFERMIILRTYDVVGDRSLMNLLEARVNGMRNADWKEFGRETVERMKNRR